MLLGCPQQVVEECDVEFEDLDELQDAAVGDIKLTVEVERAGIGVRTVYSDLPIVDVTGQLGRVLVLFVLRLEGTDADAICSLSNRRRTRT